MTANADDEEEEPLAPPERFSDEQAPEDARPKYDWWFAPGVEEPCCYAFDSLIGGRCCGWVEPPTAEEMHAAIHAPDPDERQAAIIRAWWRESTDEQLKNAWAERAYTWRELAAAIRRAGAERLAPDRNKDLNRWGRAE